MPNERMPRDPNPWIVAEEAWIAGNRDQARVLGALQLNPRIRIVESLSKWKRGEQLFQLILSGIREIYDVDAVIAGGAVRDFVAGSNSHKDVDVFIPLPFKTFAERFKELGWQGELAKVGGKNPYNKKKDNEVGCRFPTSARGSSVVQNLKVDLVFTEAPLSKENVETFPVHAQRCVWTLGEGLNVAPEAKEDIDNKRFTISPVIKDKDLIDKIKNKILDWKKRAHYKDWKIVEPEVKPWWET